MQSQSKLIIIKFTQQPEHTDEMEGFKGFPGAETALDQAVFTSTAALNQLAAVP